MTESLFLFSCPISITYICIIVVISGINKKGLDEQYKINKLINLIVAINLREQFKSFSYKRYKVIKK